MAGEALKFREGEESKSEQETKTITITVASIGGVTESKVVTPGTTLKQMLKDVPGYRQQEVRVDGKVVSMDYILKDEDLVTIMPRAIRGGKMALISLSYLLSIQKVL